VRPDLEALLTTSYAAVVGRDLVADAGGLLYDAPAVVLMHGTQPDPVFCYANRTAQTLWGYGWDEFITLPSRLSAQAEVQADRERLLAEARARGFIADYAGIRIAKDGRRFRIANVVLWNVVVAGVRHGQAAVFSSWTWLDGAPEA
jgi:hypothetical protein